MDCKHVQEAKTVQSRLSIFAIRIIILTRNLQTWTNLWSIKPIFTTNCWIFHGPDGPEMLAIQNNSKTKRVACAAAEGSILKPKVQVFPPPSHASFLHLVGSKIKIFLCSVGGMGWISQVVHHLVHQKANKKRGNTMRARKNSPFHVSIGWKIIYALKI